MVKVTFAREKDLGPLCRANEFANSFISNMVWHTFADELAKQQVEIDEGLVEDPDNEQLLREKILLKEGWLKLIKEYVHEA